MDDYDYYNLEAKRKEALETIEKLREENRKLLPYFVEGLET